MEKKHPFERAGLGKAPYRCIGMRENWYSAGPGHRQPGGSCNYCGTGILYEFVIQDASGRKPFVVGSDCVAKTGGEREVEGFREERLKWAREKRQAGAQVRRAEREKAWAAERAERVAVNRAEWLAAYPKLDAKLKAYAGGNSFVQKMAEAVAQWGGLTEGQRAAVERSLAVEARNAELRAKAEHVGQIGKRLKKVSAKVVFFKELQPMRSFSGYGMERRFMTKLETEAGDQLVYFGGHGFKTSGEFEAWSFTPKAHEMFDNIRQTIVSRLVNDAEAAAERAERKAYEAAQAA